MNTSAFLIGISLTCAATASPVLRVYTPRGPSGRNRIEKSTSSMRSEDLLSRYEQIDGNLRKANTGEVQLTEYIAWITEAVDLKKQLGAERELNPWFAQMEALYATNWKGLAALASGYHTAPVRRRTPSKIALGRHSENSFSLEDRWKALKLLDRAYRLASENILTQPERDALAEIYCKVLLNTGKNQFVNLCVSMHELSAKELGEIDHYPPYGMPLFFSLPVSYESAMNDGERIRWLIHSMTPASGKRLMADFAAYTAGEARGMHRLISSTGMDVLSSLSDAQTVFWKDIQPIPLQLPKDYQYIRLYEELVRSGDRDAAKILGDIFMNRFQLERAATYYEMAGMPKRVEFFRGNRGSFRVSEPVPAGIPSSLMYHYRNGRNVDFRIHRLPVGSDFIARLKNGNVSHGEFNLLRGYPAWYEKMNPFQDMGRLVWQKSDKLTPVTGYRNTAHKLECPPLPGGVYLISAAMEDGNESHIYLNVYDRMIRNQTSPRDKEYMFEIDSDNKTVSKETVYLFKLEHGVYRDGKFPSKKVLAVVEGQTDESGICTFVKGAADQVFVVCVASGEIPVLCKSDDSSSKPRSNTAGGCGGSELRYEAVGLSPENTFY